MDKNWFREAIQRTRGSQADLARHLGLAPSAVSRMLTGARQMKAQEAVEIARFLGVAQEEVLRHVETESRQAAGPRPRGRPPGSASPILSRQAAIPILSATHGGDGRSFLIGAPIGVTPCPANLVGVRGAYAIYVSGDEMEPRYVPGWLLHVHPFKPPTLGRDVVVSSRDGAGLIRQFVGWNSEALELRQLNPEEQLRILRAEVLTCHLVVGVDQEG